MKKSTLKRMTLACLSAGLLFSASAQAANVSYDTKYNGHCYKIFNEGMTWEQAKAACERQGGHLVTITSSEEQAVIENLLRSKGNKNNYWLGAYRNGSAWAWVTGERFSYTYWSGGQPDNFQGRENRLSMYRNRNPRGYNKLGEWNDSAPDGVCNNEPFFGAANFGYICEWDSDPNTNSNNSVDGRLKGDVNGDGKVDKSDADMLNQYIVGLRSSIPCPKNADMNSDGRHTLTDVSKIEMLCKFSSNVNSADGRMKGDVNGDGKVDKSDADMLSEYIQGNRSSLPCPKNADANGDGRITVADVTKIVSMNPTPVKHDPQGRLESCQPLQNAIRVTGYAYDEDNMSYKVRVHVYIDGTAGNSNVPSREIIANKTSHNGHGFDDTIQVPAQWCGRRTVRLYALNDVGSGTFQEIGSQVVDIPNATPQTKTAWINTQSQNLNMRSGAGQNYGIIGKLAKGTQVTVLEELSNGWAKISSSVGTGYVSSQYLTYMKSEQNGIHLNVPYFMQSDARWKSIKIGTKTIGQVGCLLTTVSMKYSYHTGTETYPNAMKNKLQFRGNDLLWNSVYKLGYTYNQSYGRSLNNNMMQAIYNKLKDNKPVIIGGYGSAGQHWVVITGYTGQSTTSFRSSDFTINDPNHSTYKTLDRFIAGHQTIKGIVY